MAKTVNRNQTLEEFRNTYNDLATDVGNITGLSGNISNNGTIVDAINEIENKTFYFQTFEYVATAGQQVFSGADRNGNTLLMRTGRFQVFDLRKVPLKRSPHLQVIINKFPHVSICIPH